MRREYRNFSQVLTHVSEPLARFRSIRGPVPKGTGPSFTADQTGHRLTTFTSRRGATNGHLGRNYVPGARRMHGISNYFSPIVRADPVRVDWSRHCTFVRTTGSEQIAMLSRGQAA